jgi:hypothetical protein
MVPTPEGGPLLSCSSRPTLMLAPSPDANRASPSGTSAPPRLCGRSRHMLRTCWEAKPQAPHRPEPSKPLAATPSRPEITAEVPPRCSPLGDENGVQIPWAAPTCPSQTYNRHKARRAGRLGASSKQYHLTLKFIFLKSLNM